MKKFSLQNLMVQLSIIPGLGFWDRWVTEVQSTRSAFGQRVGDFEAYYQAARGGASEVAGAVSGQADYDGDSVNENQGDEHHDEYGEQDSADSDSWVY